MSQAPAHRSFSQVKTYLSCPKQYQLQRIVRVPETPAFYLAGGSAVHEVIEHVTLNPDVDVDTIADLWIAAWDKHTTRLLEDTGIPIGEWRAAGRVTKEKPNKEDGAWWLEEGHQMCLRYQGWLHQAFEDGWEVYEDTTGKWVERGVSPVIGGAPVKAYLDSVFVMPGGQLCVIDAKTGSRTPDPQQLRFYALSMDRVGQIRPSMGAYWMARSGDLSAPFTLDGPGYDASFDDTFKAVDAAIRAGLFPAHVNSMCSGCSVNRACAAVGGGEADLFDPTILDRKV